MTITDLINSAGGVSVVALALGVSRRTVQMWKARTTEIRHRDWVAIEKLATERQAKEVAH